MMYQSMLAPTLLSDTHGNYKGANDTIVQAVGFDRYDTFSLWDTFRAAHPLYTIIQPERVSDMIESLLAHYKETKLLPVWSMQGNETNMMIGYHAVPVIVDAYFKGFKFDVQQAYKACKESSMNITKIGRFQRRKRSWMQPKNSKGDFIEPFIPKEYTPYFCESNAWQYYWFVPQDIPGLIKKTGGKERFTQKLDSMFSYYPESTGMIGQYAHGNEPSHHVAYLYNYSGQPSKTQELTKKILEEQYKNEPAGHCGNEDCGQMSSWYIFSSLGLYPVNPAQGVYFLTSPIFEKARIQLPEGKFFTITAKNFSDKNKYIASITLNGKPLQQWFITHESIMKGGTMEFEMSHLPNDLESIEMALPDINKIYR